MKPFNFVLTTGETVPQALQLLKEDIDKNYLNMACQIQQIILLPQAIPISHVAATSNGQPQIKLVYNLVAIIVEEPETDNLQRNFKTLFDFLNTNRDNISAGLISWLATNINYDHKISSQSNQQVNDIQTSNTTNG
jgi:hypothetical protein